MKSIWKSEESGSERESQTRDVSVPTQLARACVLSASLGERPVRAEEYQAIREASQITDQQTPHDLHNLIDWGLQSRGLHNCAEWWARILSWYLSVLSRPVRYLPWIMLAAAVVGFLPSPVYELIQHLRLPTPPVTDEMPTYDAGTVFIGLAFRTAILVFLFAVACVGLLLAAFPGIYRRTDDEDLSLFDRFADHAVTAIGRFGRKAGQEKTNCSEAVADRTRRTVFRMLRPTQVIVASGLLLFGALNVGGNFGQYCTELVKQSLLVRSAPVWVANRLHSREQVLRGWLACTNTPVKELAGDSELSQVMAWLEEPKKPLEDPESEAEKKWRSSFSELISKSNLLLACGAIVPLGLNLLALFLISTRVPLPTGDISSRLAALPAGRNTRFRQLIEDIRHWKPKPPPDGPPVPIGPLGGQPATEKRRADEVWLVSVHALSNSTTLLQDDRLERLSRKLGRAVRLLDAQTHACKQALIKSPDSIVPANMQPSCIVYFVHAPAAPTADIRTFFAEMDREFPASAKIILLADRWMISSRNQRDHDRQWRIAEPSQVTSTVFRNVHHVLASLDTRAAADAFWSRLAAEIALIVSPESSVFPADLQVAKRAEERDTQLRKALEIISEMLARLRTYSSNEFGIELRRLTNEISQRVPKCFGKEQSLFDAGAAAAIRFARDSNDYARGAVTEATTTAQKHGHKLLQVLEAWLFWAASGLSAFLMLALLTVFPLALSIAPIVVLTWAMYAAAKTARVQFTPDLDDSGNGELSIEEKARQLNSFIADAVKITCSCFWQDADDRQQACRASAVNWAQRSPCDDLPGEAELRQCWRKSFSDHHIP